MYRYENRIIGGAKWGGGRGLCSPGNLGAWPHKATMIYQDTFEITFSYVSSEGDVL